MGRQGIGTMKENGERLAEFCAKNDLVIGTLSLEHYLNIEILPNLPGSQQMAATITRLTAS